MQQAAEQSGSLTIFALLIQQFAASGLGLANSAKLHLL